MAALLQEILAEVTELLRREADPRTGELLVSPENAAWLGGMALRAAIAEPLPEVAPIPSQISAAIPEMETSVPGSIAVATLGELSEVVSGCRKCGLCATRKQTVFGSGNPNAGLVFVGEAPGEDEDRQGLPFVGRAGQLLTTIIEHPRSMGLKRDEVYICNVLKCRPPGNRNPAPEEMSACEPYLVHQLELIKPKVICALGGYAAKQLLKTDESVGRLRGKWHWYQGIPVRVTYHPSYLLRLSAEKEKQEKQKVWDDVMAVLRVLKGEDTVQA